MLFPLAFSRTTSLQPPSTAFAGAIVRETLRAMVGGLLACYCTAAMAGYEVVELNLAPGEERVVVRGPGGGMDRVVLGAGADRAPGQSPGVTPPGRSARRNRP